MANSLSCENMLDLSGHDLSLNPVYRDYPKTCLPDKLSKPTGTKAKELQYEQINESLYEPAANMVAYRVSVTNIPFWIRSFGILYYELYGKSSKYKVEWYDDPLEWKDTKSGKRAICIDLSTSDIPLLYKLTFHINTGVVQVQGSHVNQFSKIDFPKLKLIKEKIVLANEATNEDTSVKVIDGLDQKHETDHEINHVKVMTVDEKEVKSLEEVNSLKLVKKHTDPNNNDNLLCAAPEQYNSSIFVETLNRMESMFANALEKITTQQSSLFNDTIQTIEKNFKDNMQAHDRKYEALLDKLEVTMTRSCNIEKENADLKGNLKHINHTTTLEKELMKTELDSKCKILKHQCDSQQETISILNKERDKSVNLNNEKDKKIASLELSQKTLIETIDKKDEEILSLKLHNSRDDSREFQEVQRQSQNTDDMYISPSLPKVTIIGTSNTKGIHPEKLSTRFHTNMILAYTIDDTEKEVRKMTNTQDVIVFHSATNDLKNLTPLECVTKMEKLMNTATELFPHTKFIISLPTPRADSSTINHNSQITSVMLKEKYKDSSMISTCDNSNLAYQGEPLMKFIDPKDGYHLSNNGISMFASNLRSAIEKALELPQRMTRSYPRNNRGRGQYNRPYQHRGRGGRGYNNRM